MPRRATLASTSFLSHLCKIYSRPGKGEGSLTKHLLGAGGTDDDLRACGGTTNLHARVPILCELTDQQLVELGFEDTVGHGLRTGRTSINGGALAGHLYIDVREHAARLHSSLWYRTWRFLLMGAAILAGYR